MFTQKIMSCIFNIPKENRHCQYCSAICDERPNSGENKASNVAEAYPLPCKDEIDKWLWEEMHLLPGCCSSIAELKYSIAREVAKKLWRNK